ISRSTLDHVACSHGLHQSVREGFLLSDSDVNHLDAPVMLEELASRLEAADAGHAHVHQHHIRLERSGLDDSLFAAAGSPYDFQSIHIAEHAADAHTYQVMVINHQYLDQI